MNIIRRAIQPLICLLTLVGTVAHANTYVLNGNPTGLVSSAGAGSYSGGHYTASDSGTGGFAHGPATFKYVWQKSTTVPEDAPLTVIFHVHTLATVWGADSGSSANNGYANATYGPVMVASADEYIVQSGGTNVEFTINPTAAVGSTSGGYCAVDISVDVIPVWTSIEGDQWYGSAPNYGYPYSAHIMNGEKAVGIFNAGDLLIANRTWTVPSTIFGEWTPLETTPVLTPAGNLNTLSPEWRWNSLLTQVLTVTASGQVQMGTNTYNPTTATISDDFKVQVVRPASTVAPVRHVAPTEAPTYLEEESTGTPPSFWKIMRGVKADNGSVLAPTGFSPTGTYGFCQRIISSYHVGNPSPPVNWATNPLLNMLDGAFPYPHSGDNSIIGGEYPWNWTAHFLDYPSSPSLSLPLSRNDSYEITLMFKAASPGANWVPLKVTKWGWNKQFGVPFVTPEGTKWGSTNTFPTWVGTQPG